MRRVGMAFTVATAGLAATAATAQAATLALTPPSPCHLSGDVVTVSAAGYTPNAYVDFTFDGQPLGAPLLTDAAGNTAGQITLGGLKGVKTHVVKAVDEANPALTAQASFLGATRQVTVKPQSARAGKKLKLRGYGFLTPGKKAYMHVRGHGLRTDTRIGKPAGPCGTWAARRSIVPATAAAGVYKVQFDQKKRYSKKTQPRVRGTMTVTRRFSSAGAFGGAGPLYTWTQVG